MIALDPTALSSVPLMSGLFPVHCTSVEKCHHRGNQASGFAKAARNFEVAMKMRGVGYMGRFPGVFSSINMKVQSLDVLTGNLSELPNKLCFASKCVLPTGISLSG